MTVTKTSSSRPDPAIVALVAEGFLSRLSFGIISFALPLYARSLGLSLTEAGLLTSLNLAVAIVLKPVMGAASDRFGLKRSLTVAIGLRSVVSFLFAVAGSPWQLYAVRSVHGVSKSLRDPASDALMAERGGKHAVASAFAWQATAKNLAGSIGKGVAGVLLTLTHANYSRVFFISFLLSALPLYVVARFVGDAVGPAAQGEDVGRVDTGAGPRDGSAPGVMPFVVLALLISGSAQMLNALFPILATEYAGLSEAQAGAIYTVSTCVILFAGPFFGWLADHVSRDLVLMIRSAANIFSSAIYLVAPTFPGVASGKIVDELGKAAFRPAWGSMMAHVSGFDRARRARIMSYLGVGDDGGETLGPVLAGFLWSTWGLNVVLGVRIALAVAAEIYAVLLSRRLAVAARGPGGLERAIQQPIDEPPRVDAARDSTLLVGLSATPDPRL
jgi:MFS family permease